jgi:hypothetical protein
MNDQDNEVPDNPTLQAESTNGEQGTHEEEVNESQHESSESERSSQAERSESTAQAGGDESSSPQVEESEPTVIVP